MQKSRTGRPTRSQLLQLQAKNRAKALEPKEERDVICLPDEILLKVFSFLQVKDLLSCASTCKNWGRVANDNYLWKAVYCQHITMRAEKKSKTQIMEPPSPLEVPDKHWKKMLLKKCKGLRNRRFQALDKINSFTGTTDRMLDKLEKLGPKFQLCLKTKAGKTFTFRERNRKIFDTSTILNWFSLKGWPDFRTISGMQVFSLTPVLYDVNKKPIKNGPLQKCLLISEETGKWEKRKRLDSDENIELYQMNNFMIAFWKGTMEIAFISVGIHHHELLKKCLYSSSDQIFTTAHTIKPDDIDRKCGRYGYKCHILLHNLENAYFNQLFQCDHEAQYNDGGARFYLENNFSDIDNFNAMTSIDWKTDFFGGKVENVSFISLTLRDINSDVLWNFCAPLKLEPLSSKEVDFNCSEDACQLNYEDEVGKVQFLFQKQRISDVFCVQSAFIELKLDVLSAWFGRKMTVK